jgi:hypothetical protein
MSVSVVGLAGPGRTPGALPIRPVDELRSDGFSTDEELDEFLAFVAASRHADVA